ncbi:MAG: response regulator [Labilithrix sp.]|nr:response regulator [Labilithrix sp.]MCW5833746.1 response regulator [Labilithrix sp.]
MTRVLVIDGYDPSRDASARALRDAGYDVIALEEEEAALAALKRGGADVVLLDLPLAEAEEAANAIREATGRGARSPSIIALVDPSSSRQRREAGHASGIDYFFLRPCPPQEIVKHLLRMRL